MVALPLPRGACHLVGLAAIGGLVVTVIAVRGGWLPFMLLAVACGIIIDGAAAFTGLVTYNHAIFNFGGPPDGGRCHCGHGLHLEYECRWVQSLSRVAG